MSSPTVLGCGEQWISIPRTQVAPFVGEHENSVTRLGMQLSVRICPSFFDREEVREVRLYEQFDRAVRRLVSRSCA